MSRNTDIVARYAGDEFVLILPETTEDSAQFLMDSYYLINVILSVHWYCSELKNARSMSNIILLSSRTSS